MSRRRPVDVPLVFGRYPEVHTSDGVAEDSAAGRLVAMKQEAPSTVIGGASRDTSDVTCRPKHFYSERIRG